jgi:predicted phosphodiesterase
MALNDRILVISDMHHPFSHPDTVRFLRALNKKYKFTRIICIGDEIDAHAMSFHDSDPDLFSPGDELQTAIECLQPIYKMFPKVDLVESNHGSMIYRKGKHHGIPRKALREYGDVIEAPPGWKWSPDLTIDLPNGNKCWFTHGLSSDVMKLVAANGVCVVQGHFHEKFVIGYHGNPASFLFGMTVGCLIDDKALAFAYNKTHTKRPIIGCGMIIDSMPRLAPMVLGKKRKWTGFVP